MHVSKRGTARSRKAEMRFPHGLNSLSWRMLEVVDSMFPGIIPAGLANPKSKVSKGGSQDEVALKTL
jgi:hypothetical protein